MNMDELVALVAPKANVMERDARRVIREALIVIREEIGAAAAESRVQYPFLGTFSIHLGIAEGQPNRILLHLAKPQEKKEEVQPAEGDRASAKG